MLQRALTVAGLALLLASGPVWAADDPPVEGTSAELDAVLRDLVAAPRGLEAELLVFEIADHFDTAGPEAVLAALERAVELPRLAPAARERARHLLALGRLRTGDPASAREDSDARGFVSLWHVAGPFDNEGATGFDTAYEPERLVCAPAAAPDAETSWRPAPAAASSFGMLHLDALTEPDANVCLYALASLESERAGPAVLRVGAAGAVKAFWNGASAIADGAYRGADPDRFAAAVTVRSGINRLLVKVCSDETGHLALYARVTDRAYEPWTLEARSASGDIPQCSPPRRDEASPRRLPTPLTRLTERADARTARAADRAAASDYALRTRALHGASHQARDLARSACERSGEVDHCLLWADLALDRNERRLAVTAALRSEPESAPALLALAEIEREGPDLGRARTLVDRALAVAPPSLAAHLLAAEIQSDQGFPSSALTRVEALVARLPGVPAPVLLGRRLAEIAGAVERALALTRASLSFHFDDLQAHETLARAAAARGDRLSLAAHRDAILTLAGHDAGALADLALLLEGTGDLERAAALHGSALELAPNDSGAFKSQGLFELRRGRREAGIAALERAAAIRPQDAWLADYLELLHPAPRFEEPFAVPPEEFLAERGSLASGEDARYLVDCEVVRVFESGLASRFTQLVVEVGSRAAAREWRHHAIQYAPASQRIQLLAARVFRADGSVEQATGRGTMPVAEPWYRLYYDIVAEVVELPNLDPGDVIEVRYRVDDTAERNVFADYFGDLVLVNGDISKQLWRYALILPAARRAVFQAPDVDGLTRDRSEIDGAVVELFEVRDVPPIERELYMPGDTAAAAYLHVSTYDSWDDLGRWYRGLIRNQLLPDSRIAKQVRELTAGLGDERARVEAIYGWVVTATRYVGLEFGIHGYKPYRAPLVMARGFGDCKDKASLLVTMLREAGIEAELALVRTRSAGEIAELPASLSVFNHAIAYVPSLDLWLDGTAEHHGTGDLPFEDQGVIALRITAGGVRLGRTPVLGADQSAFVERLEVLLDADGEAQISVETRVTGAGAPTLRSELEAERTRRERFEAALVERYPGARLGELEIGQLTEIEQPVRYRFTAFVPELGRAAGDELEIPVDPGLDLSSRYCKVSKREHDLEVGPARILERAMSIRIPDGFRPSRLPSAAIVETRFGRLELTVEARGDEIEIRRVFALDAHRVARSDYAELCDFARRVDEVLAGDIALGRRR